MKKGSLALVFMLFASLGFAASCPTAAYSILGATFTLSTAATDYDCGLAPPSPQGALTGLGTEGYFLNTSGSGIGLNCIQTPCSATLTITQPNTNTSGRAYRTPDAASPSLQCVDTSQIIVSTENITDTFQNFTVTQYNSTTVKYNQSGGHETYCPKTSKIKMTVASSSYVGNMITIDNYNASTYTEFSYASMASKLPTNITSPNVYFSYVYPSNGIIRSNFTTGTSFKNANSMGAYCRSLLYFNNPYYGNIQLIPKVTYIPGTDAFQSFINTTDNSAYIPNNTITYVFDSVTSIWYIVPAFTCSSPSIVGSTTTLQYNPTATGTAPGGTVPIGVSSVSGSCSYATATRVITCTGTDASNTVTSLSLVAYLAGNTTDLCGATITGATGTLTCTLPNQNGTYYAYFYGTDANLMNYEFGQGTFTIGSQASFFGRDAYLAALLILGVAAMLLTSNIATSMMLGCFGLFVALGFGILPLSDAPVVVFFTLIALVIAYRIRI